MQTKEKISFDFWASIVHPQITTEYELLNAFYCFVSDVAAGMMEFEDFCYEFGYDKYLKSTERVWKACRKATNDLYSIYRGDVYDLVNELAEIAG